MLIKIFVQVVEQPRPLAAWDMVLQEMKWMAADFQQERLWKQSAARVQAAAVKQFVAEKQRRDEAEKLELENRLTQRRIAHSLATQVFSILNYFNFILVHCTTLRFATFRKPVHSPNFSRA